MNALQETLRAAYARRDKAREAARHTNGTHSSYGYEGIEWNDPTRETPRLQNIPVFRREPTRGSDTYTGVFCRPVPLHAQVSFYQRHAARRSWIALNHDSARGRAS